MARVVLSFLDDWVQAGAGRPGRSPRIKKLFRQPVEHRAGDELQNWEEAARALWERAALPKRHVFLVLPGSVCAVRAVALPPMKKRRLPRAVQDELQSREEREIVADCIPLGRDAAGAWRVLACACAREEMERFLGLAKRLGLRLEGVTVQMNALLNVLSAARDMRGRSFLLLSFDGGSLTSVLIENGEYRYSGAARLLSEPGTRDFATEVTRSLSGTLQFRAAERLDAPISEVYYSGCPDEDFEVCLPGVEELGLSARRLPDCARIRRLPAGERMSDWLSVAGTMFK